MIRKETLRELKPWAWLAAGVFVAVALVAWAFRLPDPLPVNAPPDTFSAARAMKIVRALDKSFGVHRNGSKSHRQAAEYLSGELEKLPGVTVALQQAKGIAQHHRPGIPFPPVVYETINVIARIEGWSKSALLLNAHFDTATEGPGAGDDGMGVGAVVEAVRVLASGPKPRHSVVILLNGGEEMCSVGASGFLHHPWAEDVRAYLYIDTGPSGKPMVIGAGPGNRWLLETYVGAVPSPTLNVTLAGEDMAEKGILPFTGDFVPLRQAGLVGVDIAALGGFHQIHSRLDVAENIDLRTLQLMGDSLLAGSRALLQGELAGNVDKRRVVYYDVLGLFVPIYSYTTAGILAALAGALSVFGLLLAVRRRALTPRQIVVGASRVALLFVAAFLAAVSTAVVVGFVLKRPHGWYSAPWIGIIAFGLPATAAALGVLSLRRRDASDSAPLALWAGALVGGTLLLTLTAGAGLGFSYLPLWCTGFGAAGFVGTLLKPSLRNQMWLMAFVPGAVPMLELVTPLYPFAAAATGLVPSPNPLDPFIAGLVGIVAASMLPLALVPIAGVRRLRRAALVAAILSVAGATVAATHFPYSSTHPKRIQAAAVVRNGESSLLVASHDALALGPVLADISEAKPLEKPWSTSPGIGPRFTWEIPITPPNFQPLRIDVLSSSADPAADTRTVTLRLNARGPNLFLYIPKHALRAWSIGKIPERSVDENRVLAIFENASHAARDIDITFAGQSPVKVELIENRGPSYLPAIIAFAKRLPSWVALDTLEIQSIEKEI